jgi:hypothetical protein
MKSINANHRIGVVFYAGVLTLCLALQVATPALGLGHESRGKIIHPALRAAHSAGGSHGLTCFFGCWLRRWWW